MPDQAADDRTEAPTDKRRSESRSKGNVTKSTEINSVLVLLTGLLLLKFFGPWMMRHIVAYMREMFGMISHPQADMGFTIALVVRSIEVVCYVCLPVCIGVMIIGIIANLVQVGILFTLEPLIPNLEKINVISGFGRLIQPAFGLGNDQERFKLTIIGFVAYITVKGEFGTFIGLCGHIDRRHPRCS